MSNVKEKFLRNQLEKNAETIRNHLEHIEAFRSQKLFVDSVSLKEYDLWISERAHKVRLLENMKEKIEDELNQEILNKKPGRDK